MASIFKSEIAKTKLVDWHKKFLSRVEGNVESHFISTRFGKTHLLVSGPIDGPPVVLLHGALASSAHALSELKALALDFRVYAIDIIGQSPLSADQTISVANADYGLWLQDVMTELQLESANIVGVSWGGFVAQRFAAINPGKVSSLVLLVPAGMVSGPIFQGIWKIGIPSLMFSISPSENNLKRFTKFLLTQDDKDWTPYLGDAFQSFKMNMNVPKLSKKNEFVGLAARVQVIGADLDLSFPGKKVLDRAGEIFPNLSDTHLLKDCRHCPPTNENFRAWLSERIKKFILNENIESI